MDPNGNQQGKQYLATIPEFIHSYLLRCRITLRVAEPAGLAGHLRKQMA
jgi:hypothetical protein